MEIINGDIRWVIKPRNIVAEKKRQLKQYWIDHWDRFIFLWLIQKIVESDNKWLAYKFKASETNEDENASKMHGTSINKQLHADFIYWPIFQFDIIVFTFDDYWL